MTNRILAVGFAAFAFALAAQIAAAQQLEFQDSMGFNGHPDSRTPTLMPLELEPKDYYPLPRSGMGVWRWRQSATQYHRSWQAAYRLDAVRSEYKISELKKRARREWEEDQAARIEATRERLAKRPGVGDAAPEPALEAFSRHSGPKLDAARFIVSVYPDRVVRPLGTLVADAGSPRSYRDGGSPRSFGNMTPEAAR